MEGKRGRIRMVNPPEKERQANEYERIHFFDWNEDMMFPVGG
jgi:hypothetical protein